MSHSYISYQATCWRYDIRVSSLTFWKVNEEKSSSSVKLRCENRISTLWRMTMKVKVSVSKESVTSALSHFWVIRYTRFTVYEAEWIQPGRQEHQRTAATGLTSTSAAVVILYELNSRKYLEMIPSKVNRPKCSAVLFLQCGDLTLTYQNYVVQLCSV